MGSAVALSVRLAALLGEIRRLPGCGALSRLSVALYDPRTDILRAYAQTGDTLEHYQLALSEVPSLAILASGDQPRVVDDLESWGHATSYHTIALREAGFRSSLTIPVHDDGQLRGFIFFNADLPRAFTPAVVALLAPFAASIAAMTAREVA